MFKMTPAVKWLERDYDTATDLTYTDFPEVSIYVGLRRFEAEGSDTEAGHVGPMFIFKSIEYGGLRMHWGAEIDWGWAERAWGMPLDKEVRWL